MKKQNKKAEKTLGILSHLQKNIPQPAKPAEEEKDPFEEEEEEEENWDLLKPKPPEVIMGSN